MHFVSICSAWQEHSKQSAGVKMGVQRCALNAVIPCLKDAKLQTALQEAGVENIIKVGMLQASFMLCAGRL